jgi:hypothetical protein
VVFLSFCRNVLRVSVSLFSHMYGIGAVICYDGILAGLRVAFASLCREVLRVTIVVLGHSYDTTVFFLGYDRVFQMVVTAWMSICCLGRCIYCDGDTHVARCYPMKKSDVFPCYDCSFIPSGATVLFCGATGFSCVNNNEAQFSVEGTVLSFMVMWCFYRLLVWWFNCPNVYVTL